MKPSLSLLLGVAALLNGCGGDRLSGGGDEMGNFVRVSLRDSVGNPMPGARVMVRSLDEKLIPGSSAPAPFRIDSTGPDGSVRLLPLPPGRWLVVGRVAGLGISDTLVIVDSTQGTSQILSLRKLGGLRGRMQPRPGEGSSWIRFPGRGTLVQTDSAGNFLLDSMEPGPALLLAGGASDTLVRRAVQVIPDSIVDLGDLIAYGYDWSAWKWNRSFYLHTGSNGIAITGVVTDLPVPLRLTATDVDFSKLRSDFGDLRITRRDGKPLPVSVERWDATAKVLTVWTRLDTVHPGRDSQEIVVRCGNPAAAANWTRPFDAGQGWIGVWHMGYDLADQSGQGRDAANSNAFKAGGVVGESQFFKRDTQSHLQVDGGKALDARPDGDLFLEAWARLDTKDAANDPVISRGNGGYRLQRDGSTNFASFAVVDSAASGGSNPGVAKVAGTRNIADGAFHHLVGMRRGDSLMVFVDGILDGKSAFKGRTPSSTAPLGIGTDGSNGFWEGLIDEVRVGRISRSNDWIRLSYEAQRIGGKFITR